jgi:hypothetical protein
MVLLGQLSAADDDFKPLFNGKDLTGFKTVGVKDDTFKVVDGEIHCTGKPNGYFRTDKSYKNYHLKFEWKYVRPADLTDDAKFTGNSGCLVHITGDDKVWPKCIEVQGMNRDMCKTFPVGFKGEAKDDPAARKKAIKPVGEWNTVEIISKDGTLTSILNGAKIAVDFKSELMEGPIGWQSEGAPIYFRKIMIKEMK